MFTYRQTNRQMYTHKNTCMSSHTSARKSVPTSLFTHLTSCQPPPTHLPSGPPFNIDCHQPSFTTDLYPIEIHPTTCPGCHLFSLHQARPPGSWKTNTRGQQISAVNHFRQVLLGYENAGTAFHTCHSAKFNRYVIGSGEYIDKQKKYFRLSIFFKINEIQKTWHAFESLAHLDTYNLPLSLFLSFSLSLPLTPHTHTHIYILIYIYIS